MLLRDDVSVAAQSDLRGSVADVAGSGTAWRRSSGQRGSGNAERSRSEAGDSDSRNRQRAVQRSVEYSRMRVLPEPSDDDLPGLRGSDRNPAAAAWQDSDDSVDVELRH